MNLVLFISQKCSQFLSYILIPIICNIGCRSLKNITKYTVLSINNLVYCLPMIPQLLILVFCPSIFPLRFWCLVCMLYAVNVAWITEVGEAVERSRYLYSHIYRVLVPAYCQPAMPSTVQTGKLWKHYSLYFSCDSLGIVLSQSRFV